MKIEELKNQLKIDSENRRWLEQAITDTTKVTEPIKVEIPKDKIDTLYIGGSIWILPI